MNQTEVAIANLKADGYSDQDILDALLDGEALAHMGLEDEDQTDIECAVDKLRRSKADYLGL